MNARTSVDWDNLYAEARAIPISEVAERLGAKLKRSGQDRFGPCVAGCATTDGLVITERDHVFICRPSGAGGDSIDLVVHAHGCDKREALEFVLGRTIEPGRQENVWEISERQEAARAREVAAQARRLREDAEAAARRRKAEESIADVLRRARPIAGTHADAYLRETRGLAPALNLMADVLFVKDLAYWGCPDNETKATKFLAELPAMVAIIRDVSGEMIGLHRTYLNLREPTKYVPPCRRESAKKVLGRQAGGLIHLGPIRERLAIGEGIEKTLGFYQLGLDGDDALSIACGVNLHNMMGGRAGTYPHPTRVDAQGKSTPIPNGFPDMSKPGMRIPQGVRELVLLQDGTSEPLATRAAIVTAGRRHVAEGIEVRIQKAPLGFDFDEICLMRARESQS